MASSRDTETRLAHLEQIVAQTSAAAVHTPDAAADVHLASVPAERIRRLTAELADESSRTPDQVDALFIRLLLNEYASAVEHLRAVARIAAASIDGAARPMREAHRAMYRHAKNIERSTPNWLAKNSEH